MPRLSRSRKLLLLALLCPVAASCATIIQGTTQDLAVSSTPTGASITLNGQHLGMTPLVASLERKDNHLLRMELEGYQPYEVALTRSVSGWVVGNIVFGGIIGLAVDAISGGMYKLKPDQIETTMLAQQVTSVNGDGIVVAVVLRPDPSWEWIGQLDPLDDHATD